MSKFVATNIRLPKEDLVFYRQVALASGKSFSELVREALAKNMHPVELPKKKNKKYPSFWEIEKIAVSGGPKDGSTKHDRYLY
jgi:hypothetical protein